MIALRPLVQPTLTAGLPSASGRIKNRKCFRPCAAVTRYRVPERGGVESYGGLTSANSGCFNSSIILHSAPHYLTQDIFTLAISAHYKCRPFSTFNLLGAPDLHRHSCAPFTNLEIPATETNPIPENPHGRFQNLPSTSERGARPTSPHLSP